MTVRIRSLAMVLRRARRWLRWRRAATPPTARRWSTKYETYLANMSIGRIAAADSADGRVALEQCKAGNAAACIPVLEQKLRNAKIDLPPRG